MSLNEFALALVIGAASLAGCSAPPPQVVPPEMRSKPCTLSSESYRVYDAVMEDLGKQQFGKRWHGRPNIIVLDKAKLSGAGPAAELISRGITESFWESKKKGRPAADTLAAFNSQVGYSCSMNPPHNSLIHYKFIGERELHGIFEVGAKSGWSKFYELYPKSHGYWDFSPVGFNTAGDQALVYVGHHCGGLCGNGSYIVLQKKGDQWSVESWTMAWIS